MSTKFSRIVLFTILIPLFTSTFLHAQDPIVTVTQGIQVDESGKGVAWGNSTYVSIFSNGVILRSSDGESWTRVQNGSIPVGTFQSLSFGSGLFVIAGNNGLISTSPDGITWTARSAGTSNHIYDLKYLNGSFYAVGQNRLILQSADGLTWNTVSVSAGTASDNFFHIGFGNGVYAIGARSSTNIGIYVYYSSTAASNTWSFHSVAAGTLNRLLFIGNRFYIFTSNTTIYTSTNASSWTSSSASMPVTLPNATVQTFSSPNQAFSGLYDGTRWIFFGSTGYYTGSYGGVFVSNDGISFTLQAASAYIVSQGAAWLNGKYFQWGNQGIVVSTDGINYKYLGAHFYSVAKNNTGTYVGVGIVGNTGQIFSSTDFHTWTNRNTQRLRTLYTVLYDGSRFVAAGDKTVVSSPDGITWTPLSSPTSTFNSMIFDGTRYVAVGNDGDGIGHIQTSSDGITWTTVNNFDNEYSRIRYINGRYFALGLNRGTYRGVIMHSTNGTNWTDVTPPEFEVYLYNDVTYDGSKYVFVGSDWSYSFFSVTSTNPSNSGTYANTGIVNNVGGVWLGSWYVENVVGYANGRFVASALDVDTGESYILLSSDGINWTPEATGVKSEINDILASGDQFRLVGSGDYKFFVNYASTLPVQLKQFDAKLVSGDAQLTWSTASEQNSREFRIQHSTNGQNWEQLGVVAAAGNSEQLKHYQFKHRGLLPGTHFYRLLQVDYDNRQSLSAVRKLVLKEKSNLRVYPNPSNGDIQLQKGTSGSATVIVINANGQKLYQSVHTGSRVTLSSQSWPAGVYKIRVLENGQAEVITFLKK